MSDLPASLPDPPVPGTVVWRGWITKKGSFMPTLKKRFCTLRIGPEYAVEFDYREEATSLASKGSRIFSAGSKCVQSGAIGNFPKQQCLTVVTNPGEDNDRLHCCFDSAEERDSFRAAVEWAFSARSHVAAFRSKQEEVKKHRAAEEMQRVQAEWLSTHQMLEDELSRVQPSTALTGENSSAAQIEKMRRSQLKEQEFALLLAHESEEYKKTLQQAAIRRVSNVQSVEVRSARLFSEIDSGLPPVFSVDGKAFEEFVQTIVRGQAAHAAQLAAAAKIADQIRHETKTRASLVLSSKGGGEL